MAKRVPHQQALAKPTLVNIETTMGRESQAFMTHEPSAKSHQKQPPLTQLVKFASPNYAKQTSLFNHR
jgi:hypothetical protein